jgi:hypothetical protein
MTPPKIKVGTFLEAWVGPKAGLDASLECAVPTPSVVKPVALSL